MFKLKLVSNISPICPWTSDEMIVTEYAEFETKEAADRAYVHYKNVAAGLIAIKMTVVKLYEN